MVTVFPDSDGVPDSPVLACFSSSFSGLFWLLIFLDHDLALLCKLWVGVSHGMLAGRGPAKEQRMRDVAAGHGGWLLGVEYQRHGWARFRCKAGHEWRTTQAAARAG